MDENAIRFAHNLPHCYLEVARAAAGPLPLHHPTGKDFIRTYGQNPVASAVFSIVSISVIYSYLAVEAFVNYQLYRIWERRHDGSNETARFLQIFGDENSFGSYGGHAKFRDLKERYKALCKIMSFNPPFEKISKDWQGFNDLARTSRRFLVHPSPSPDEFDDLMKTILEKVPPGTYPRIASALIGYLYDEAKMEKPQWLCKNTLITFRGINVLIDKPDTSDTDSS